MKLLVVESSILGEHSVSRQINRAVVERLRGGESVDVTVRDLAAAPLPHLTLASLPPEHPLASETTRGAEAFESQAVLREFLAADTVVVGAPMYNFTMPSQLKAWIDRIVIPGTTFRYDESGPAGLVQGKRVIVVIARGGFYGQGSPAASFEHLDTYLRTTFGFIGVTDYETVIAEGLSRGAESRGSAIDRAVAAARELRAA